MVRMYGMNIPSSNASMIPVGVDGLGKSISRSMIGASMKGVSDIVSIGAGSGFATLKPLSTADPGVNSPSSPWVTCSSKYALGVDLIRFVFGSMYCTILDEFPKPMNFASLTRSSNLRS